MDVALCATEGWLMYRIVTSPLSAWPPRHPVLARSPAPDVTRHGYDRFLNRPEYRWQILHFSRSFRKLQNWKTNVCFASRHLSSQDFEEENVNIWYLTANVNVSFAKMELTNIIVSLFKSTYWLDYFAT